MSVFLSTTHLSKCGSFPLDNAAPHMFTATTRFAVIFWRRGGALTTAVYPENSGWRRLVNITIRWQSNRYQGHPALVQKLDTLHCAEWTTCLVWQCMDAEWFCCSMFIQITMPCISEYTTVLYCITTQHGCRLQRILKMTKYARRGFGDRCPSSQLSLQDPSLLSTSSPATI